METSAPGEVAAGSHEGEAARPGDEDQRLMRFVAHGRVIIIQPRWNGKWKLTGRLVRRGFLC